MVNTIILLRSEAVLTKSEYQKFSKGDTIWGIDSEQEKMKRWNIKQKKEAKEELAKHACSYHENIESWSIQEFALEYCEYNEEGEFVQGSDYDLAAEK